MLKLLETKMAPISSCFCWKVLKSFVNIPHKFLVDSLYANSLHLSRSFVLDKCITPRYMGTSHTLQSQKKFEQPIFQQKTVDEDGVAVKKKKKFIPRITLIGTDDTLDVLTMEEAEKMSKRRGLKLVKINDADNKTSRPVYKLMTGAQYLEADLERRRDKKAKRATETKAEKLVTISSKIGPHDLDAKVRNVVKWLQKNHTVRIVISGDSAGSALTEKVFGVVESGVKECGRITQKQVKGNDLKFQIQQPKKPKEAETGTTKVQVLQKEDEETDANDAGDETLRQTERRDA